MRGLLIALLFAVIALAANVKLFLKDGGYHVVREYKVEGDRVRYYSVERGDWEEIPLELVDIARTESETKRLDETRKADAVVLDAEDKAEREARREAERVPMNAGTYYVNGDKLDSMKPAESKLVTAKGRSILKVLAPIPIVAGKVTVELDGESSANVINAERPEFYIRLSNEERFGLVRLEKKKGVRVVDKISVIPVTKELVDDLNQVETFRKQVGDMLYKIWPTKPLEPGEYAIVEYTEGKNNLQVWDFSVRPH
jgi:hypothetical protein